MPQQVKVFRDLEFLGNASYNPNIKGYPMYDKVFFTDHFIADADESDWVEEDTNGCTTTHSAANGGLTILTLGAINDDVGEFSHTAQWSASKNCVMEARVHSDIITLVGINVGWVSADMSTNDTIAFSITAGAATLATGPTNDGAAFVFDTDGTPDVWYCAATKATVDGTPVAATGTRAPVASTFQNLRVALNSDGDATFYFNGEAVGFLETCITAATLLTPYCAIISRTTGARVLSIDRITCWQDE